MRVPAFCNKQRSINVAILAFETFTTTSITGPMDILNKSSLVWRGIYGMDVPYASFNVELVALTKKPLHFGRTITLHPHASIATARKPDLILIPSAGENVLNELGRLRPFIPWIKQCASQGARVVSLCTGAFLLAETGLLDGRAATTYWFLADVFRKTYPAVKLQPERLIVDEGNVITSGAATSFLDLALHLIELYNGYEAALLVAKAFLIEMGRRTQRPQPVFSVHMTHKDRPILWAQHFVQQNLCRRLTTEMMAKRLAMSVRTFDRRFRNAVGEAPSTYLQRLRVEKAKRLFETTGDSIEEITVRVGYKDERSFRRLFRRLTGLSPRAYRLKYGLNRPVQCLEIPFLPANISAAK